MMKSLFFNIMSLLAAAVPLLLPTSCTENIPAAPLLSASLEVKPMQDASKSASSVTETTEDAVRNWNLLVFDRGVLAAMYYRDCRYDFFDSEATRRTKSMIAGISVVFDRPYDWFAVANVGNLADMPFFRSAVGVLTEAELRSWTPSIAVAGADALPMAWHEAGLSVSESQLLGGYTLPVVFERLVSRYDIIVNQAGLSNWAFTATGLKLQGADSVTPFADASSFRGSYAEAEYATAADVAMLNSGGATRYYPLENCFGNLLSVSDPMDKSLDNVLAADASARPSFVELSGRLTLQDGSFLDKDVTYRFYLGENSTTNFDVKRNVAHVVTLRLTDALIDGDAALWKVETGRFDDTRLLAFADDTVHLPAGMSYYAGILAEPGTLNYLVLMDAELLASGVTITGVIPNSGTAYSLPRLQINVPEGAETSGHIRIRTLDGQKYDDLAVSSYLPGPSLTGICFDRSHYALVRVEDGALHTACSFAVIAQYSDGSSGPVTPEASYEDEGDIWIDPVSGTLAATVACGEKILSATFGGFTASAQYSAEDLAVPVGLSGLHLESQDDEELLEFVVDAIDATLQKALSGGSWTADVTGEVGVTVGGQVVYDGYESGRGMLFHFTSAGSGTVTFTYTHNGVSVQWSISVTCDATGHVRYSQ